MKCHHCPRTGISIFETKCPGCGKSLSAGANFRYYAARFGEFLKSLWYGLWGGKSRVGKARCPVCGELCDLGTEECPRCHFSLKIHSVLLWYLQPFLRVLFLIYGFVHRSTPLQSFLFLFLYLGTSTILFFACLARAQALFGTNVTAWFGPGVTAVFFTALLLFAASYILPMHKLRLLLLIRPTFKIGIVLNFMTLMLFIISWVSTHPQKAWTLVGAFFVTLLAFLFFTAVIYPIWCSFAQAFQTAFTGGGSGGGGGSSDHYRGRRAEYRENQW